MTPASGSSFLAFVVVLHPGALLGFRGAFTTTPQQPRRRIEMAEHGMPDARRTKRTKGVSCPLPDDHKIRPDSRWNTKRMRGQRGHGTPAPEAPPATPKAPEPVAKPTLAKRPKASKAKAKK